MPKPVILIVDDEKNTREGLKKGLLHNKYKILLAEDGKDALGVFSNNKVDVMLADLKMPGLNGIELMKKVKRISPDTITVILTAYGTVETAVGAMREGAYDFITKPYDTDNLRITCLNAAEKKDLLNKTKLLQEEVNSTKFHQLIGQCPEMQKVFQIIKMK